MSTVRFDMPHALVTLTVTDSNGVEIEVWPKQGQSAFVVVPPEIARQIAEHINRLADEAEGRRRDAGGHALQRLRPDEPSGGAGPRRILTLDPGRPHDRSRGTGRPPPRSQQGPDEPQG